MDSTLTNSEQVSLCQVQSACRSGVGHVLISVLLMLDHGRLAAAITLGSGLGRKQHVLLRLGLLKGVAGLTGRRAARLLGIAE